MKPNKKIFSMQFYQSPGIVDLIILSFFTIVITAQPFFLHSEIIMMETGIHLPAINAIFHGAMPYRDFFYLRGPLELYVPTAMMLLFGKNMIMLPIFYYVGTVLTLLACVAIAKQLYRSRFIFYLAIPVLIARTFPRVSYNYWGGMRYALGFFAILFAIIYFKKQKRRWIFFSGIVSALSFLTTVEAGISAGLAIAGTLLCLLIFDAKKRKTSLEAVGIYFLGVASLIVPFILYFQLSGALLPFVDTTFAVGLNLTKTFIDAPGNHPETIKQFLFALVPSSQYFKIMTPVYFYGAFFFYIFWRLKTKRLNDAIPSLICLAFYGLILYAAAFRKIEGHHFEMALQPEKLLFFFIAEEILFFLKRQKEKILNSLKEMNSLRNGWTQRAKVYFIHVMIFAFIASSLGYSIARYNSRFPAFQLVKNFLIGKKKNLSPLGKEESATLRMERADGWVVPVWQAEEMKAVTEFLKKNTAPGEVVFTYPELGDFNFLADRPFLGKFPIATFSWIRGSWSDQLIEQLQKERPRYIVMTKLGHRTFPEVWYFRNAKNKEYFQRTTEYILSQYSVAQAFSSVEIYKLK